MYAESGSALRREIISLLELHRVQRMLGPTSAVADHVTLIRQYRGNVLAWTSDALQMAAPMSFTHLPPRNPNPFESSGNFNAARDLARALAHVRERASATPAALSQLTTRHENALVERWRQAARAAALAEGDITHMSRQSITSGQAAGIVSDASAVTQALVVLDRRYRRVPGWRTLDHGADLGWTALAAALDVGLQGPDFSLDAAGWKPRVRPMRGNVAPGLLGVLQAEHNVLAGLDGFPHALRLRLVIDSQRVLSARLAPLAQRVDAIQAEFWTDRTNTYAEVQRHMRDIGGIWGGGERAAAEAANVVARLKSIDSTAAIEPRTLNGFRLLAERIDQRIAAVVEHGLANGDFVQRVKLPRLVSDSEGLVRPARVRYRPVPDSEDVPLVRVVRQQLGSARPRIPSAPDPTRVDLHSALTGATRDGDGLRL